MKQPTMPTKFKMQTWKLAVEGEFDNEEQAIKELADRYMSCSKCDQPGDHPIELLSGGRQLIRDEEKIGKRTYFYVEEVVHGYKQWILKYTLTVYPFKAKHWWERSGKKEEIEGLTGDPFLLNYEEKEFRYEIIPPEKVKEKA